MSPNRFSLRSRTRRSRFDALARSPHTDVLVIGAGINGVAIARDLALQGVDVTLIDAGDIAASTSAASSRMIHGGLRYLENGEFRLVRESVAERNRLLANAPHAVAPLATTVPLHGLWGGITQAPLKFLTGRTVRPREARGAILVKVGLTLYDWYSRLGRASDGTAVPRHRFHGPRATQERFPNFHPGTLFSATYFDAMVTHPERLAMELADDAESTGHARVVTYASAVGARGGGVVVRDGLSGDEVTVRPRVVVNASGPMTDLTNSALGSATHYMGGTKGSHIVVDNPALHDACRGHEIFFENHDGRIVLVYPMHGRVILGTTDIPADPRETPVCTEEEVDYFIELAARVFPGIPVTREQIVFRYSGIRPLPAADADEPGRISRDYRVERGVLPGSGGATAAEGATTVAREPEVPLISVVGGKWTTFRALGERVADDVLAELRRERAVDTAGLPIGGGRDLPKPDDVVAWIAAHLPHHTPGRGRVLLDRYGTRAAEVGAAEVAQPEASRRLVTLPDYTVGEVQWIARHEHVVRLADVVLRRTQAAFQGRVDGAVLREVAEVVGEALGWSWWRRREEVRLAAAVMRERHGVDVRALRARDAADVDAEVARWAPADVTGSELVGERR